MFSYSKMVKSALKNFRQGRCDIYELVKTTNNGITFTEWNKVVGCIPCHLSYKGSNPLNQTETTANGDKIATLFLDTDITVKEGSKIEVNQNGVTNIYYCTGVASVYSTHQEIGLKRDVMA